MLETTYGLHMDQLRILITPDIRKLFMEKSSSLIFQWHPQGHFPSVADATRTLRTCSRMKIMIRKSLTIFHIRQRVAIWRYSGYV